MVSLHGPLQTILEEVENPTTDGSCKRWPFTKIPKGYGFVSHEGSSKLAHRLTLSLATDKPYKNNLFACHSVDCPNRDCIALGHLRWDTASANMQDKRATNTCNTGSRNGRSLLTEEDVLNLRGIWDRREMSQKELAKEFGVAGRTVNNIINRVIWKSL